MKKIITISSLLFTLITKAQLFSGAGGAIQDNGQDNFYTINVSGLNPASIDSVYGLEQVCINITHPVLRELFIYLQSPSGNMIELALGSSANGNDYTSTCFDNFAGTSITLGNSPYTGNYRPVGYLGRFNTGQSGNGNWKLIVHDGFPFSNAGNLISWSIKFGNNPAHPVIFQSSNLPIVFVNTSQPISDIKTVANMGIIDNGINRNYVTNPINGYSGKAEIHTRGSSTKNFQKKSFSIETQDASGNELNASLVGMPSESDWVLGASFIDKTLLRIPLAMDMFRWMGHYASRYRHVEMIVNNEYQGVYTLMEKPKRDSNRVNITKLGPNDNASPDITGGYIIKIDRNDELGWYSLYPGNSPANSKFYYQYVYPKDSDITLSQQNYIHNYLDGFETVMNSSTYADPLNGYSKYIDVGSFVDFFIINELSKNVDAYRLSTYLYKKNISDGGKLYVGPVWDYDIAWHNCNYGNSYDPNGWAYQLPDNDFPIPTWWSRLMQDPNFANKVYCRWNALRQTVLSTAYLNNYIDSSANLLNESQERNFRQWPILGAYISPNPQNQTGANYLSEVSDLKNWLSNRITWLDANITGGCVIGIVENELVNNLNIYPNPMEASTTFSWQNEKTADVSLCIRDVVGKEVARFLNTNVSPGTAKIVFERNQIQAGVYSYELQVNMAVKTGKIVIQ